ncbi:hypothetical protein [Flavobacterium aestivum]|uniref:hypothetical protein n=1 Tax=Flavobacterium aestivum TaxID=3003257 RepID=UPI002483179C|nr:hypothetical protein [Flavobacterium aestivum]
MDFLFTKNIGVPEKSKYTFIFNEIDIERIKVYNELSIKNKIYCFIGDYNSHNLETDKAVAVNMWNRLVLFSIDNGDLLYYSGFYDSFVGIESLSNFFLVVTDSTIFKINKENFYPYGFTQFPYNICDYELSNSLGEIKIKFVEEEMQDDIVVDLGV